MLCAYLSLPVKCARYIYWVHVLCVYYNLYTIQYIRFKLLLYHEIFTCIGTECHVLEDRPKDFNTNGLGRWTFSILAFWGESPKGNFIIDIFDKVYTHVFF